jgi:hypothetical protein
MDRQARVGILRNLNRPPLPPTHCPPLIGRWMPLRSSRRPPQPEGADTGGAGGTGPQPDARDHAETGVGGFVQTGSDGISGIDIDRLIASVEAMGQKSGTRVPFGPQTAAPKPVLDRSWMKTPAGDAEPGTEPDLGEDRAGAGETTRLISRLRNLFRRLARQHPV